MVEVYDIMVKIGITENVLKTLGGIGNRWPPQKTCADCAGSSGGLLPPSPPKH
jgi:hypothetical protein